MKIILDSNKVAVFFGVNSDIFVNENNRFQCGLGIIAEYSPENSELVSVDSPEYVLPHAYKLTDTGWVCIDQAVVDSYVNSIKKEFNSKQKQLRADAYSKESDPLFFKYQREEATKEEWLAKVNEIVARYPYQE